MQPNSNNVVPSPLLERPDAARYLKIGLRTLDDYVKRGRIRVTRLTARRVAFHLDDLNAFLLVCRTGGIA